MSGSREQGSMPAPAPATCTPPAQLRSTLRRVLSPFAVQVHGITSKPGCVAETRQLVPVRSHPHRLSRLPGQAVVRLSRGDVRQTRQVAFDWPLGSCIAFALFANEQRYVPSWRKKPTCFLGCRSSLASVLRLVVPLAGAIAGSS